MYARLKRLEETLTGVYALQVLLDSGCNPKLFRTPYAEEQHHARLIHRFLI